MGDLVDACQIGDSSGVNHQRRIDDVIVFANVITQHVTVVGGRGEIVVGSGGEWLWRLVVVVAIVIGKFVAGGVFVVYDVTLVDVNIFRVRPTTTPEEARDGGHDGAEGEEEEDESHRHDDHCDAFLVEKVCERHVSVDEWNLLGDDDA